VLDIFSLCVQQKSLQSHQSHSSSHSIASSFHTAPGTSTPSRESPSFLCSLQESQKLWERIGSGLIRYSFDKCLQKCWKQTLKHFRTVGRSAVRSNYVGEILRSFTYEVCPKINENDFFCAVQKGQERKVGVEAGRGGTQVYSFTFFSRVRAFIAVGTIAKCVGVFVSCHGRKCKEVWSSVTRSSSTRNSENLVPNVAVVEDSLWGRCLFFSPSPRVAQGVQERKGERWRRTACRVSFNFKNWEQCGSCEGCSG